MDIDALQTTLANTSAPNVLAIAALQPEVANDPRRIRWAELPMPDKPISLIERPAESITVAAFRGIEEGRRERDWLKTFDGKRIPFPQGENPEHIELVRRKLPPQLRHLEGFFSKKASTKLPPSRPGHDVVLELNRPIVGQPARYNTPFAYMELERETIRELADCGFIEKCDKMPATAASTLFVPKKDTKERRFCVDYRFINDFITKRLVTAPDVPGTIARVGRAKRLSKIDIIRAFNRLLVDVGSRYLTAFRTRFGTYQWKVLPFGLSVGPAWFQALINAQLNELLDSIASAYADDVLIFTEEEDEDSHFEAVEEVIYRLHGAELQGDIKKSAFNVTDTGYLGMRLEVGKGVSIDPEKIRAITEWSCDDVNSRQAV